MLLFWEYVLEKKSNLGEENLGKQHLRQCLGY